MIDETLPRFLTLRFKPRPTTDVIKKMFELAGLSTFLDVFQKAFGLIEKHKDQKRKLFTEIVEPIYTELSVVVGEYYNFFRSCRDEFSQTNMSNWGTVLNEKRKEREEIVLARNKVLGITDAFLPRQYDALITSQRKEDKLLYDFAHAINLFFFASDDRGDTRASSLFLFVERVVAARDISVRESGFMYIEDSALQENVIEYLERSLQRMEWQWHDISKAYGDLRVHCLS
jgi:hypothetical protein